MLIASMSLDEIADAESFQPLETFKLLAGELFEFSSALRKDDLTTARAKVVLDHNVAVARVLEMHCEMKKV